MENELKTSIIINLFGVKRERMLQHRDELLFLMVRVSHISKYQFFVHNKKNLRISYSIENSYSGINFASQSRSLWPYST